MIFYVASSQVFEGTPDILMLVDRPHPKETSLKQELGRSFRTNNISANPSHSSIRAHCEGTCNTPVSSSGFSILDSAPDFVSLRILESLHIFKLNPSINDTNSSFPLYIVK